MAQITVNARTYELVTLDDLTLDEAMVVWDYTKLSIDQVPDIEGFHPGLIKALLHISVARGEPGESARAIRDAVGAIKVAELNSVFIEISEETSELPPPSGPPATAPPNGSGVASSNTGGQVPEPAGPNGTGGPGSDTGATSAPRISVG